MACLTRCKYTGTLSWFRSNLASLTGSALAARGRWTAKRLAAMMSRPPRLGSALEARELGVLRLGEGSRLCDCCLLKAPTIFGGCSCLSSSARGLGLSERLRREDSALEERCRPNGNLDAAGAVRGG